MESPDRAPVTNQQVGKDLGITHSAVSRIRSGKRHPSVALMRTIESKFHWPIAAQMRVFGSQVYARQFERELTRHYDQSKVVK